MNFGRKPTLEDEIASLETDEEIEKELESLKASAARKTNEDASAQRSTKGEPELTDGDS